MSKTHKVDQRAAELRAQGMRRSEAEMQAWREALAEQERRWIEMDNRK